MGNKFITNEQQSFTVMKTLEDFSEDPKITTVSWNGANPDWVCLEVSVPAGEADTFYFSPDIAAEIGRKLLVSAERAQEAMDSAPEEDENLDQCIADTKAIIGPNPADGTIGEDPYESYDYRKVPGERIDPPRRSWRQQRALDRNKSRRK